MRLAVMIQHGQEPAQALLRHVDVNVIRNIGGEIDIDRLLRRGVRGSRSECEKEYSKYKSYRTK